MDYIFTFIEGIASFISPCVLPMLPIYISYFIGEDNKKVSKAVINSIGFVLGFTTIFIILSVFASNFGGIISSNIKYVKIVFGIIIILLRAKLYGINKNKVSEQIKRCKYKN